jgi:hypothetical protein
MGDNKRKRPQASISSFFNLVPGGMKKVARNYENTALEQCISRGSASYETAAFATDRVAIGDTDIAVSAVNGNSDSTVDFEASTKV